MESIPRRPGTVSYFKDLPRLNKSQVQYLDNFQRRRLQSLQDVDDLVEGIFETLLDYPDVLANTYIIYTADNGFHLGQHRLPAGKTCGIEEDVNVPFIIRGPEIAKNKTLKSPSSHTDLAPTLFKLADFSLRDDFDGLPIPVKFADHTPDSIKTEHVNIECWGSGIIEGTVFANLSMQVTPNNHDRALTAPQEGYFDHNTYKTLRIVSEKYEFMYTVWCNGEHELYDMKRDPYQTFNLHAKQPQCSSYNIAQLVKRLDTLVLTLKNCQGDSCRHPRKAMFPSGEVTSLQHALATSYDEFFSSQPWVSFDECTQGYIPELEGPARPYLYQGSFARDAELRDEHWI
ncbi:Arylsulfatase [Beauveria bassiana]|uniref:Arylsulfatase, putative n=1 Tax=Beauveria bassiana (strain ARSEF 2860) TaxID=655819 RepID=J5JA86_BEAB2|nr:arylsulfatase, putative [Beauveria bassiana ARSEF 2860]EJP60966.1 arylsulfatase, putative [Beauveria bassiana ARSEF 2860]KAF1738620.1 Arylsulfatase [Beauveria bassiana]